jgi:hypothetical protein
MFSAFEESLFIYTPTSNSPRANLFRSSGEFIALFNPKKKNCLARVGAVYKLGLAYACAYSPPIL